MCSIKSYKKKSLARALQLSASRKLSRLSNQAEWHLPKKWSWGLEATLFFFFFFPREAIWGGEETGLFGFELMSPILVLLSKLTFIKSFWNRDVPIVFFFLRFTHLIFGICQYRVLIWNFRNTFFFKITTLIFLQFNT